MKCQLELSAAMHSQWFEYFLCKLGTAVEHTALDSFEKQVMGWGLKEKSINQYMKYFHCYHFLIFFFFKSAGTLASCVSHFFDCHLSLHLPTAQHRSLRFSRQVSADAETSCCSEPAAPLGSEVQYLCCY